MPRAMYGSSVEIDRNINRAMEDQAAALDRIEEGKQAALAAAYLAEPILVMRESAITFLITSYRAGKTDHDRIVGAVAELAVLDKLVKHMANVQLQGDIAANKEFNNG